MNLKFVGALVNVKSLKKQRAIIWGRVEGLDSSISPSLLPTSDAVLEYSTHAGQGTVP